MSGARTRHRLMLGTGALGACLLLGATLTTAHARFVGHRAAAVPTYGGSYSYWSAQAPDCLDPQKTSSASSDIVDGYVLDPLLYETPTGKWLGDLATSYKSSDHGLKLTFHLRQGVKFSNGDPFTATDVKDTYDRAANPSLKSPVTAGMLRYISQTKVISKYVVEFDLTSAFRPLLLNLGNPYTGILDHRITGDQCGTGLIGTGPYKLQSTGPAFSTVTMVANKYHTWAQNWEKNKKGVPYVTTVTMKAYSLDSTAISELLSGGLDIASIPGTQLSRVQGNSSIKLFKFPGYREDYVEFNTANAPFNTVGARRALGELIDRKAWVKAAYAGQAQPVTSCISPAIPDYDQNTVKVGPKYNVSAAAKYIADNHLSGPYNLLVLDSPNNTAEAEILQAAAAQAGMKLNIVMKAQADLIPAAAKGQFDILIRSYAYPDPDAMYLLLDSSQSASNGGLNVSNYVNPTLDNLLVKGRTTLNIAKARADYFKAQELVAKQAVFLGTVVPSSLEGFRANLKGLHFNKQTNGFSLADVYVKSK